MYINIYIYNIYIYHQLPSSCLQFDKYRRIVNKILLFSGCENTFLCSLSHSWCYRLELHQTNKNWRPMAPLNHSTQSLCSPKLQAEATWPQRPGSWCCLLRDRIIDYHSPQNILLSQQMVGKKTCAYKTRSKIGIERHYEPQQPKKLKHHQHYHVSIDDVILTLIFAEIMDQFGEGFPAKNT